MIITHSDSSFIIDKQKQRTLLSLTRGSAEQDYHALSSPLCLLSTTNWSHLTSDLPVQSLFDHWKLAPITKFNADRLTDIGLTSEGEWVGSDTSRLWKLLNDITWASPRNFQATPTGFTADSINAHYAYCGPYPVSVAYQRLPWLNGLLPGQCILHLLNPKLMLLGPIKFSLVFQIDSPLYFRTIGIPLSPIPHTIDGSLPMELCSHCPGS